MPTFVEGNIELTQRKGSWGDVAAAHDQSFDYGADLFVHQIALRETKTLKRTPMISQSICQTRRGVIQKSSSREIQTLQATGRVG
mmetsp:Transcript_34887/g.99263  ORF Transcript_34887/g.99263 Transcript_34887/m.99263 type:complete len:85 (-) Transcript_34887:403-657(-)